MLAERLSKAWDERRGSTRIDPIMKFTAEGLVLGAETLLIPTGFPGREPPFDEVEPRLRALLAAAHLRRPSAASLKHLRKAAERRREGASALADMHLALSGLNRLEQPAADAHRLFLADGLLKSGVDANALFAAIARGDPVFEPLQKYDPNQPRVPAGSGRTSGEWTSGGDAEAASQPTTAFHPEPEVNPHTITEVSGRATIYACQEATVDCIDTALDDADLGAANDNGLPTADLNKCRDAKWACDVLSEVIEYAPLLDYGGVIFPHRGVVIMRKGQLDTYYPPLPGGRTPPFRRPRYF